MLATRGGVSPSLPIVTEHCTWDPRVAAFSLGCHLLPPRTTHPILLVPAGQGTQGQGQGAGPTVPRRGGAGGGDAAAPVGVLPPPLPASHLRATPTTFAELNILHIHGHLKRGVLVDQVGPQGAVSSDTLLPSHDFLGSLFKHGLQVRVMGCMYVCACVYE
jgi:hypothetical protein